MRERINKRNKKLFIVLLLLIITVGFATLSTNLNINGTSKINNSTWDIHFENIQINSNSVTIDPNDDTQHAAIVDANDNTLVTYSVLLNIPGDFYEFNVDVTNAGSIDGMIESITSTLKINNADPITIADDKSNLPAYLDYSVTYSDDTKIEPNHELKSGSTETYKVRVEFKRDINNSDLPQTPQTLQFGLQPKMIQSDTRAKPAHIKTRYLLLNYETQIGEAIPEDELEYFEETSTDIINSFPTYYNDTMPFYIKYTFNNNDEIEENYLEFAVTQKVITDNPGMREGIYSLKAGDGGAAFEENVNTLKKAFGTYATSNDDVCTYNEDAAWCESKYTYITINKSGNVYATQSLNSLYWDCNLESSGKSYCYYGN